MVEAPFKKDGDRPRERRISRELLDELPATDPRAIQSRRDLRRVNYLMGNARILARLLTKIQPAVRSLVEIGAGDGQFMYGLAKRLAPLLPRVEVLLVDQQELLTPNLAAQFTALGWTVRAVRADVFDWLATSESVDAIVANLFLHHFDDVNLARLFQQISLKTNLFAAAEPRRFSFPSIAGELVRLIGCNEVTRHDAVLSVGAGFARRELMTLWPGEVGWHIEEGEAGFFSHWFCARHP
jgi:hypothetical protein